LVVGYRDGMVDLLSPDAAWAINDIEKSSILASKRINGVSFRNDKAYLSCGFGIVVLDMTRKEVRSSYMIGNNSSAIEVHATSFFRDSIFAATEKGVYKASLASPNLADFQNWQRTEPAGIGGPFGDIVRYDQRLFLLHKPDPESDRDSVLQYENGNWKGFEFEPRNRDITDLDRSGGKLIIAQNGYLQAFNEADQEVRIVHGHPWSGNPKPEEALFWEDRFWFADQEMGLLSMADSWNGERILPDGPGTKNCFDIATRKDQMWIATGAVDNNWNPRYQNKGVLNFHEDDWSSYQSSPLDTLFDPISVAIDPDDPEHVFIGTRGSGLIEMQGGKVEEVYGPHNSSLEEHSGIPGLVAAWGTSFDEDGNLWVTNSYSADPISVLTDEGEWHSLNIEGRFSRSDIYGSIMCTSLGQKWVLLPRNGLLVFETNGTPADPSDDSYKVLTSNAGNGGLPSERTRCMAEDEDQEVWVGTDQGVAVFYTPDDLFSQNPSDAEEILIDYDGFLEPLLETEEVTSIEVDGADRKWIGTANSGVFHVSPDGKEELHRFSEAEDPLIDDGINDIGIHPETGEVFFGTQSGIISYRAQATEGKETLDDVVVYPNPVRKDHDGPIAIRGLPPNSTVHITDINGDLVHKTRSEGGQAIWDGTDSEGLRVRTGVYLVFVASPNGEQSQAGKLMFFH
jgi:hypothetical protein